MPADLRVVGREALATSGHSVRVPGPLSETVEKRVVLMDEYEAQMLGEIGERLEDIGAYTTGDFLRRLRKRWEMGPKTA